MKAATARRLDLEERMRDTARRRVREAQERAAPPDTRTLLERAAAQAENRRTARH